MIGVLRLPRDPLVGRPLRPKFMIASDQRHIRESHVERQLHRDKGREQRRRDRQQDDERRGRVDPQGRGNRNRRGAERDRGRPGRHRQNPGTRLDRRADTWNASPVPSPDDRRGPQSARLKPDETEGRGRMPSPLVGHPAQVVRVTFESARGRSGSSPRARAAASIARYALTSMTIRSASGSAGASTGSTIPPATRPPAA